MLDHVPPATCLEARNDMRERMRVELHAVEDQAASDLVAFQTQLLRQEAVESIDHIG